MYCQLLSVACLVIYINPVVAKLRSAEAEKITTGRDKEASLTGRTSGKDKFFIQKRDHTANSRFELKQRRTDLRTSSVLYLMTEDFTTPHDIDAQPPNKRIRRGISQNLRDIFRNAYKTPGLEGEVLFVAKKLCEAKFNIQKGVFKRSDILSAELHLFKVEPKNINFNTKRRGKKSSLQARVSIHQVLRQRKHLPSTTRMLDSSLVNVQNSGWVKFDITNAFKDWARSRSRNKGLEVWVESTQAGKASARVARKVRIVKPESRKLQYRPAVVVYFKQKRA